MTVEPTGGTDLQRRIASATMMSVQPKDTSAGVPEVVGRQILVVEDEPLVVLDLVSVWRTPVPW